MVPDDRVKETLIITVAHRLRGEVDFEYYVGALCTTADDLIEGRPVPQARLELFEDFCAAIAEEATRVVASSGCIDNPLDNTMQSKGAPY